MKTIKPIDFLKKLKVESYVDSWQLRDKKDIHPSHRVMVFEEQDILKLNDFISLEEVGKIIDKMEKDFNKKENYSLKGEKKLCCVMTLVMLKKELGIEE